MRNVARCWWVQQDWVCPASRSVITVSGDVTVVMGNSNASLSLPLQATWKKSITVTSGSDRAITVMDGCNDVTAAA